MEVGLIEHLQTPASPANLDFLTIAKINAQDFALAQRHAGFSGWSDFDDFCDERQCLALSYGAAGVTVAAQRVSFGAFEGWARLTGAPLDLDGLDEFAAHWRYRVARPRAPVVGRCGAPGQPERDVFTSGGAQRVVVRADIFERWRGAYVHATRLPAPDLDAYATRVVECCIPDSVAAWRWALKRA